MVLFFSFIFFIFFLSISLINNFLVFQTILFLVGLLFAIKIIFYYFLENIKIMQKKIDND